MTSQLHRDRSDFRGRGGRTLVQDSEHSVLLQAEQAQKSPTSPNPVEIIISLYLPYQDVKINKVMEEKGTVNCKALSKWKVTFWGVY